MIDCTEEPTIFVAVDAGIGANKCVALWQWLISKTNVKGEKTINESKLGNICLMM